MEDKLRLDDISSTLRERVFFAARDGMSLTLYALLYEKTTDEIDDLLNSDVCCDGVKCTPLIAAARHGRDGAVRILLMKFRPPVRLETEGTVKFDEYVIEGSVLSSPISLDIKSSSVMASQSVGRFSMVVVLNGVLVDECPTSVRALLAAHPGYRDAAAQLLAAAARVVGPAGLLYVAQRELAAVVPHDKNVSIIGSDDATSCIIVVVRHSGSGAVSLAHLDGSGTAEAAAAMVARVQQLAVGYPEGRLELQLVGGFTDPHRYSDELFSNIMLSFHRMSEEIDLTLACCCELNTALGGGSPAPLVTGVGVDIRAGDLFPATFPDKGPELPLRGARNITGGPNSGQVLDIYDNGVGMLRIGPFTYEPLRGVDLWLDQSDDFILQHLSTTPAVEGPHFVHHIRVTLKFIQQHPFPAVTVFPDNRPHYYRRDEQTGCWVPVRF